MSLVASRVPDDADRFPWNLPCAQDLDIYFEGAVTFLVGENGSGKSTVLEAIADLAELPVDGGSRNEMTDRQEQSSELAEAMRGSWRQRPRDAYFFRAETLYDFANLLERRRADPEFMGNPYAVYGGQSLHKRSHGESFLDVMTHRLGDAGLYLFDEPEAALSPQRQLGFLALLDRLVREQGCQFIIATHSPIILTYPQAEILAFDERGLTPTELQDTENFSVTRMMLTNPASFWERLRRDV